MAKSKLNHQVEQEKLLILTKFLQSAPFDGWNNNNLRQSAKACGSHAHYEDLLFPNLVEDLTEFYHNQINEQMTSLYLNDSTAQNLKISEKIAYLIELKFKLYSKNTQAIQSLLQYSIKPQNLTFATKLLWDTCDQIWYLAGDKSTDYNYYSKRGLLACVYSSSLLYWLADESENHSETSEFIRRKIQSVMKIQKVKNFVKKIPFIRLLVK